MIKNNRPMDTIRTDVFYELYLDERRSCNGTLNGDCDEHGSLPTYEINSIENPSQLTTRLEFRNCISEYE